MNRTIIDALAILTAILLLIFTAFAFNYKKGITIRHRILAAFLFANALFIIDFSIDAIQAATGLNLQWFSGIGFSFGYLFGPLLYLYNHSITDEDFKLVPLQFLHILLFIAVFVLFLIKTGIPHLYFYFALYLQITPYMIACFLLISQYRNRIKNFYSSLNKLNLTWMLYVVGAFFFMWMIDLIDFIRFYLKLTFPFDPVYLTFFSLFINFIFAILIFYKALQHPEIFTGIPEHERLQKYEQSRLTEEEKMNYLKKLQQYFINEKPFLKPELTIAEVASDLNLSTKYLSQVINESIGKNFYDYINSYRIEEAKKQLIKDSSRKTVLEVLYESGFNSKSAFNTAFKKHTGYTPSEYRKRPMIN